jgi:hypothetical protein
MIAIVPSARTGLPRCTPRDDGGIDRIALGAPTDRFGEDAHLGGIDHNERYNTNPRGLQFTSDGGEFLPPIFCNPPRPTSPTRGKDRFCI